MHKKLFSSTRQALQRQGEFRRGRERLGAEDLPDSSLVLPALGTFRAMRDEDVNELIALL